MKKEQDDKLQIKLKKVLEECERLREENNSLKEQFNKLLLQKTSDNQSLSIELKESKLSHSKTKIESELTPDDKISLFRSLFRGREDVYSVRWESQKGKSGYSPACANEWDRSEEHTSELQSH